MKIALISNTFPSEREPFYTKFIHDHASLLAEIDNTETKIFIPVPYSIPFSKKWFKNKSPLQEVDGIHAQKLKYFSIPRKKIPVATKFFLSKAVRKKIIGNQFDLLHLHWLYPTSLAAPALKKAGFKCVLTVHGSDWYKNKSNPSLMNLLEKSLQALDWIFFVGPEMREDAIKKYSFLKHKSSFLPNAVDGSLYYLPSADLKKAKKQEFGWSSKQTHLLCVAAHKKVKGVDLLLKAANMLLKEKPAVHFHLVGSSKQGNLGIDYDAYKNVSFYQPVSPLRLVDFYHAADAYVSPSRVEGFGLAMTEAATTGLPLVATSTGIAPKIINQQTGILCEPYSAEELYQSILRLTEQLSVYEPEKTRQQILEKFGKESVSRQLIKKYQDLVTRL